MPRNSASIRSYNLAENISFKTILYAYLSELFKYKADLKKYDDEELCIRQYARYNVASFSEYRRKER